MAVDGCNAIARPEPCFPGRAVWINPADHSRIVLFTHRFADFPNDNSKKARQQKAEERPCKGNDDFVERLYGRQGLPRAFTFSFDRFHRRHLGKRDVATGGNCPEGIFDTANLLFPDRLAEPDREPVDFESAPASCQEMPQLVNENEQVEQEQDLQKNQNELDDGHS